MNFKYQRITSDTIKIKGVVSNDGTEITFIKGKKGEAEEVTVNLLDYLKKYAGEEITFVLTTKDELDLDDEQVGESTWTD